MRAHKDRIGAQVDGEEAGGDAQADLGQLLRDRRYVAGAAAQTAVFFGYEEQLQADLGSQQLADDILGEDLLRVQLRAASRVSACRCRMLREQVEDHLPFFER